MCIPSTRADLLLASVSLPRLRTPIMPQNCCTSIWTKCVYVKIYVYEYTYPTTHDYCYVPRLYGAKHMNQVTYSEKYGKLSLRYKLNVRLQLLRLSLSGDGITTGNSPLKVQHCDCQTNEGISLMHVRWTQEGWQVLHCDGGDHVLRTSKVNRRGSMAGLADSRSNWSDHEWTGHYV